MDHVAAVMLAGGRGVGFGPLSEQRTKAAFPIAGYYRIVDFALSNLAHSGARQVGIVIQYLPASLMDHIGSGRAWDFDVADRSLRFMTPFVGIRETRWFHGTADALAKNINLLNTGKVSDILVLSGDHAYRMDYRELIHHHRQTQADLTMACVEIPPASQHPRFGNIEVQADGRVRSFVEKPQHPVSSLVSMGVFCFRRDVLFDLLTSSRPKDDSEEFTLAGDVIQPNIGHLNAQAWVFDQPWYYLADLQEYFDFHMQLARGELNLFDRNWDVMTNFSDRNLGSRTPAFFAPGCEVSQSIVSPGCQIDGQVTGSVLSPGVRVGAGSKVRNCILFHDVIIGEDCTLEHVVVDKDVIVEKGANIGLVPGQSRSDPFYHPITVIPKGYRVGAFERIIAGATPDAAVHI